jgi:hypothetical protein
VLKSSGCDHNLKTMATYSIRFQSIATPKVPLLSPATPFIIANHKP